MKLTKDSKNALGMNVVGFGTYQLSPSQAEECVLEALNAGFRNIDSAEGYQNEEGTGRAIKASGIPREEIFVTTKLFPGYKVWGAEEKDFNTTIETLKRQLKELQLDYVDLYLIHAPLAQIRLEQWKALVELKKMGLTKHIGVANYTQEHINEIIESGLPLPEANQVEFHPICAQVKLTPYMQEKGITKIAYSSLAPLSTWRVEEGQGGEVLAEIKRECQNVVAEIAKKLNVSEAKVLLRWGMQKGYSVLTKSSKLERIRENIELFDFEISQSDMEKLALVDQNQPIAWAASGIDPSQSAPTLKK